MSSSRYKYSLEFGTANVYASVYTYECSTEYLTWRGGACQQQTFRFLFGKRDRLRSGRKSVSVVHPSHVILARAVSRPVAVCATRVCVFSGERRRRRRRRGRGVVASRFPNGSLAFLLVM